MSLLLIGAAGILSAEAMCLLEREGWTALPHQEDRVAPDTVRSLLAKAAAAVEQVPDPSGQADLILVLVDQTSLVAAAGKEGYEIAAAELKAQVRSLALAFAPRMRLGAIVAAPSDTAGEREIIAAARLLAASRAMTGVVIDLASGGSLV